MTFREKLAKEHPDCIGEIFMGGAKYCPHKYGYEEEPKDCTGRKCSTCWDREIPETEETNPVSPDENEFLKSAIELKKLKDAYMEAGFTSWEAFLLVQSIVVGKVVNK